MIPVYAIKYLKYALAAFCLLLAGGCAPYYAVSVDAISDPGGARPDSYVLKPGSAGLLAGDLQFKWVAGSLHQALARKGFRRVRDPNRARLVITLAYEISDPEIYTQVHTQRWYNPARRRYDYETYTTHHQYYTRHLVVAAYPARQYRRGAREQLWRVSALSQGATANARRIFPGMIAALEPYIGTTTDGVVEVVVETDDPRLP